MDIPSYRAPKILCNASYGPWSTKSARSQLGGLSEGFGVLGFRV